MAFEPNRPPFNRTRTRGVFYPSSNRLSAWWNTPNTPSYSATSIAESRGTVEMMSDRVTPDYKKVSRQGGIVNSKMSKTSETRSTTTSGPRFKSVIGSVTYWGDLQGPHWTNGTLTSTARPFGRPPSTIDLANLRAIASTRALSSVSKPDYSGAVTLGEFAETLHYLRDPVASARKLSDAVHDSIRKIGRTDKGFSSNAPITKALGEVYLSIQFGLKPLLAEITGILETLRDASHIRPLRQTARAKETREFTDTWIVTETIGGITYQAEYKYKEVATVMCCFLYEQSASVTGADHFGFNVRDLPKAAWQVATLSFVADWFLNIGDLIGALTPNADARIIMACTSTKVTTTLTRKVSLYSMAAAGWTTERDGTGEDIIETVSYEREPWVDPPSLAVKNLDWLKNEIGRTASLYILASTRMSAIRAPMKADTRRLFKPGSILPPHRWYG